MDFSAADHEKNFTSYEEKEQIKGFKEAFTLSALKLIAPLFPLFWFLDLFHSPERKWQYLILRLSILPFCFVLEKKSRTCKTSMACHWLSLLLVFYPSLVISYITLNDPGVSSSYCGGLNLLSFGAIVFFPWDRKFLPAVVFACYFPFFIGIAFKFPNADDKMGFVVNLSFILGSVLIASVIRTVYNHARKNQIRLHLELEKEINDRNSVIQQKTDEAIRLASLTKQFSPQIVRAIQSGKIKISADLRRSKICVIYVDIVGFTEKVNRLDHQKIDKVLAMFMEDVIKIFLKYDLTIDKFIGDCALAFSNEPVKYSDYVERPIRAAIEVQRVLAERSELYSDIWEGDFKVRTGIDCSFVAVGFYGSDKYFKSFTAIGRAMNLANRICSSAEAGQILISNDVANALKPGDFKMEMIGRKSFKGFGTDLFKIWEVTEEAAHNKSTLPTQECPNCNNILHLDSNLDGIFVLKCRECGFELENDSKVRSKKPAA